MLPATFGDDREGLIGALREVASEAAGFDEETRIVIHRPLGGPLPHDDCNPCCWCGPRVVKPHELRDIEGLADLVYREAKVN